MHSRKRTSAPWKRPAMCRDVVFVFRNQAGANKECRYGVAIINVADEAHVFTMMHDLTELSCAAPRGSDQGVQGSIPRQDAGPLHLHRPQRPLRLVQRLGLGCVNETSRAGRVPWRPPRSFVQKSLRSPSMGMPPFLRRPAAANSGTAGLVTRAGPAWLWPSGVAFALAWETVVVR